MQPGLESLVRIVERIEVGVIGQAAEQFIIDGAVVFDPCVLIVAIPQCILHPVVCANLPRQLLEQKPGDTILVEINEF